MRGEHRQNCNFSSPLPAFFILPVLLSLSFTSTLPILLPPHHPLSHPFILPLTSPLPLVLVSLYPFLSTPNSHTPLHLFLHLLLSPAAVRRSQPRPPSGCQVTRTEALTSPPPRPIVNPPPLPWQRRQRPAEWRLATRRLQKEEEGKQQNV